MFSYDAYDSCNVVGLDVDPERLLDEPLRDGLGIQRQRLALRVSPAWVEKS